MTEVSHPQSSQIAAPEPPVSEGAHNRQDHNGPDWLLILLSIFVILTLIASLLAGILLLLAFLVPGFAGFLDALTAQVPLISSLSALQVVALLLGGSLLFSLTCYLLARWRVLSKTFLWPSAGCPACGDGVLLRIHRRRKDRLYSWIGIPVGRYQCRECRWKGLRIRRGSRAAVKSDDWSAAISATHSNSSTPADAGLRSEANVGQNDVAVAKWQARLADQETAAYTVDEATPDEEDKSPIVADERITNDELAPNGIWPNYAPYPFSSTSGESEKEAEAARQQTNKMSRGQISAPFGLNMRADPRPDGELLRLLEPGTNVILLDAVQHRDETTWRHVQVAGQEGWVISEFLETEA